MKLKTLLGDKRHKIVESEEITKEDIDFKFVCAIGKYNLKIVREVDRIIAYDDSGQIIYDCNEPVSFEWIPDNVQEIAELINSIQE